MKKRSTKKSQQLLARAEKIIPRASQTLSKAPDQFIRGVSPYAIAKGKGCYVWDVDGNKYIDLISSLGAIILGHQHPVIDRAVIAQRKRGVIFSLPGDIEVELAEEIARIIPFAESVRFGLNGADATSAAIRVARAYTGRDHVAKCGYHGWSDWSISTHPLRSRGVPPPVKALTHEFSYNKIETLEKIFTEHGNDIAAVILEPYSNVLPKDDFLKKVKDLAHKHGAVLIFDELVTGFRIAKGGAAEYFGVSPDLATYGKAISNGEPLSVLVGRKEVMSVLDGQDVFFSTTYAGYLPSIAAAIANLRYMKTHNVQKKLWNTGELFMKEYDRVAKKHGLATYAEGLPFHPYLIFKNSAGEDDLALRSLFIQEVAKRGILVSSAVLINYAHERKYIMEVIKKLDQVFAILKSALKKGDILQRLEGPAVRARNKPSA